ncbi:MAG: Calx-beta domain-containing protein [Pyrinomonadaceae bacterium]
MLSFNRKRLVFVLVFFCCAVFVLAKLGTSGNAGIVPIVDSDTAAVGPTPTATFTPTPQCQFQNFSNPAVITILDNTRSSRYPSNIAVAGLTGTVTNVTATLVGVSHTFPDDIDIMLVGPGGQSVLLMSDAGGSSDISNVNLQFDDAAPVTVPDETQIVSGTFKPTNFDTTSDVFPTPAPTPGPISAMGVFNGTNPNGTWSLYVRDDTGLDLGSISGGWAIHVEVSTGCITPTATATATATATFPSTPPHISPSPTPFAWFSATMEDESQTAAITINRDGNFNVWYGVQFSTQNGTASGGASCSAGVDYISVTQIVTFAPGETTKTVNVPICGDNVMEPDETVSLRLETWFPQQTVLTINDTASHFKNAANISSNAGADGSPYPSNIAVSGAPSSIESMRITLYDYQSLFSDDTDFLLIGPDGQNVILMADAGGNNLSSAVTLNFRDTASAVVPDNGPLITGDFEPTSWIAGVANFPASAPAGPYNEPGSAVGGTGTQTLLGNFGGANPNGTWSLYVRNQTQSPQGAAKGNVKGGWGLEFNNPTAPTYTPTATATATATPVCGPAAWVSGPAQPPGRYAIQGVLATDTQLYIAGGQSLDANPVLSNQVSRYSTVTNTWSNVAPLPVALGQGTAGAWNGKIYIAGGFIGGTSVTNALRIYDIATNTWTSGANLPAGVEAAAGAVVNGKFYVMGGDDFNNALNTNYIYDIATNTWSTGAALPDARTNTYGTAFGGMIYVYGGVNIIGTLYFTTDTLLRYDPAANTWTDLGSAGTIGFRGNYGAVSPLGTSHLLITDGADAGGFSTTTTHIFSISSGTFSVGPPMIRARAGHAQGTLPDGRVLVADGFDTVSTMTSSVETLFNSCAATTPTPMSPTPTATKTPTFTPTFTPSATFTPTPSNATVQFNSATYNAHEPLPAVITITRTGDLSGTNVVFFSTLSGGTATGGPFCNIFNDYITVSQQPVIFGPGDATATVNVTTCADTIDDGGESVNLGLSASNTTLGTPSVAVLTIYGPATPTATITPTATATVCPLPFSNPAPITINDNATGAPYPSNIAVSGLSGTVTSVRVDLLDFTHTFPDDVDIMLVGPGGQNTLLLSDVGGGFDVVRTNLTFDDAVPVALPDDAQISSGSSGPTNYDLTTDIFPAPAPAPGGPVAMGVFNGTDPNGTWSLYVRDDLGVDTGRIAAGWRLHITTTNCSTPTGTPTPTATYTATPFPTVTETPGGGFSVQLSSATYSGDEGQSAAITITKFGNPVGGYSFSLTTSDYTATGGTACGMSGVDYVRVARVLTFNAGETIKIVNIQLCSDELQEPTEAIKLTLAGYGVNPPGTAILDIIDADAATPTFTPTPAMTCPTPGTLDTSFNGTGVVTMGFGAFAGASSVAIQPDGKIIAFGSSSGGSSSIFSAARYNSNGLLDTSFNDSGIIQTSIGVGGSGASSVALQSDGKIVAAGASVASAQSFSTPDIAVVRYNNNGSLDASFNGSGIVTTRIGGGDVAHSVAIQPDGKIIVAGGHNTQSSPLTFALVRYNSNGSLDTSFNGTGKVLTPNGAAYSVAIQSDGKIIAAGDVGVNFAVARYNADGTLDPSFNGTGVVVTAVSQGSDGGRSVAIQSDGKIVVAGYADDLNQGQTDFVVVRYNSNGTLDTSFNGTGIVRTAVNSGSQNFTYSRSLSIQSDGKIVVVGSALINSNYTFAVVRYNRDGTLDTSFNGTGKVTTPSGGGYSVALQPNGKIVAAGSSNSNFAIARYNAAACTASISGRVMTAGGFGIRNAKIVVTGNSLVEPRVVTTGSFGYFMFEGLATGETYVVTVNSRRYTFSTPSRVINLVDNVVDADFIADPQE